MRPRNDSLASQNAGPLSASGMPEAGDLPIPAKLARAEFKDMVRISDARMSGTAYGSIVLHATPDAARAAARSPGPQRRPVPPLSRRTPPRPAGRTGRSCRAARPPPPIPERGYALLYRREILQADRGCDFNFLRKHPLAAAEG